MNDDLKKIHPYLPKLLEQFQAGKVDRREFLRTSTLLGLSAGAAFSLAGCEEKQEEQAAEEAPAEETVTEEEEAAEVEVPAQLERVGQRAAGAQAGTPPSASTSRSSTMR